MRHFTLLVTLSITATLLVLPGVASAAGSISALSLSPDSVRDGASSVGTVSLAFPDPAPTTVLLFSGDRSVATVPATVVVPAGATSASFPIATNAVAANTTVTITARWFGVTRTTTVTVTPGAPAAADRVAIKKATWKRGLLTIEATSTNPNAILSVFGRSGNFMFTLTNNGGGKFSDQRGFVFSPEFITVRSNFGGSASATLGS